MVFAWEGAVLMAIVDERGRLFGRLNLLDAVLLVLAAGLGTRQCNTSMPLTHRDSVFMIAGSWG